MFDVAKSNQLLRQLDDYKTLITLYDDSDALRKRERDSNANRLERMRGITASTLPTRTVASQMFLYGDTKKQRGDGTTAANTAVTGVLSTVQKEGLSVLPTRLHHILSRGGTFDEAAAAVHHADELATRDARIEASMAHVPATAAADSYWESVLKLSMIVQPPSANTMAAARKGQRHGGDLSSLTNSRGGSAAAAAAPPTSNQNPQQHQPYPTPHNLHTLASILDAIKDTLKLYEGRIEAIKQHAMEAVYMVGGITEDANNNGPDSGGGGTCIGSRSTRAIVNAKTYEREERMKGLKDECDALLDLTEAEMVAFAVETNLATVAELHRTRAIGTYMLVLQEAEAWLASMASIHKGEERLLDEFEQFVIRDCIEEQRGWASEVANANAPIEAFQVRTKIITDLRQAEQEHRVRKVEQLSDLDPGLLHHQSEKNKVSATMSRRFQMLQHIGRRAMRLAESAHTGAHSAGQRTKAAKVSDYVLHWVSEITENNDRRDLTAADGSRADMTHSRSALKSGGGIMGGDRQGSASWRGHKRRVGSGAAAGNHSIGSPLLNNNLLGSPSGGATAYLHNSLSVPGSPVGLSLEERRQRVTASVGDRTYSRFVTSGAINGVDMLSRVSSEEMADQLTRIIFAFQDTGVGADVIARRNELDAITDYIRSAIVHPTLRTAIDVSELKLVLEDLKEWEEQNPNGTNAEGYSSIIEVLRSSASQCGLSILADFNTIEYDDALTTKPPLVGVVPTEQEDEESHSARPFSAATLFDKYSRKQRLKEAKVAEAPVFDAIYDCCDLIEAMQQLRIHVRIKGRFTVPSSFMVEGIEPLQVQLNALLADLEGFGIDEEERAKTREAAASRRSNTKRKAADPWAASSTTSRAGGALIVSNGGDGGDNYDVLHPTPPQSPFLLTIEKPTGSVKTANINGLPPTAASGTTSRAGSAAVVVSLVGATAGGDPIVVGPGTEASAAEGTDRLVLDGSSSSLPHHYHGGGATSRNASPRDNDADAAADGKTIGTGGAEEAVAIRITPPPSAGGGVGGSSRRTRQAPQSAGYIPHAQSNAHTNDTANDGGMSPASNYELIRVDISSGGVGVGYEDGTMASRGSDLQMQSSEEVARAEAAAAEAKKAQQAALLDTLMERLNTAGGIAGQLVMEARDTHGVSVPASCFMLTRLI